MIEQPKTGRQRKKYRLATAILTSLLVLFAAAAVFLTIKTVTDYVYMAQRRRAVLNVEEAGGLEAVKEKIDTMTADITALTEKTTEKQQERDTAVKGMDDTQKKYDELVAENESLSKTSDADKYAQLNKSYEELEKKYEDLKSDYDKLKQEQPKPDDNKVAYLTFDDGLSSFTENILDTLKKYNVKATFFVNGYRGRYSLFPRIVDEGHTLGNHTYSHEWSAVYKNPACFKEQIVKLNDIIKDKTGYTPTVFRFPGGSNTPKCGSVNYSDPKWQSTEAEQYKLLYAAFDILKDLGMKYFDWNVSSGDAEGVEYTTEQLVSNVLKGAGNKNTIVVLMHEKKMTADALPKIIEALKDKGYTFKPLTTSSPTFQFIKQ